MMKELVINAKHGGFGLSHEAMLRYAEIKNLPVYTETGKFGFVKYSLVPFEERLDAKDVDWYSLSLEERAEHNRVYKEQTLYDKDIPRDDPALVQVVQELGSKKASGRFAALKIVRIPDDIEWEIDDYDGLETIHEVHQSWS